MNRRQWKKVALYGFLTWFVPFMISFFFFGRDGKVLIPIGLMKSIMVVVGAATGACFLVLLFRVVAPTKHQALAVGMLWLVLNLGLDLLILVPVSKIGVADYFAEIGLRYLLIPIMCVAIGATAIDKRGGEARARL
ncbi:MAG TPA: hypothetical protein VKF79_05230 [Candidatus Acidoferrum sp.]|nr:hypothetical protein [Candidatus Acidoferrum sp.]